MVAGSSWKGIVFIMKNIVIVLRGIAIQCRQSCVLWGISGKPSILGLSQISIVISMKFGGKVCIYKSHIKTIGMLVDNSDKINK